MVGCTLVNMLTSKPQSDELGLWIKSGGGCSGFDENHYNGMMPGDDNKMVFYMVLLT
jgi:hypothetical protein